jgi:hypothetical protein
MQSYYDKSRFQFPKIYATFETKNLKNWISEILTNQNKNYYFESENIEKEPVKLGEKDLDSFIKNNIENGVVI